MEKVINFLLKNQNQLLFLFVIVFFLVLTIPTLISDQHFLYNLEPYPDGLYYTLSAKNFIEHGRLALELNNVKAVISQPPLYSLILSTGYLVWNNPVSFYIVNMILMLSTFLILENLIIKNSANSAVKVIATLLLTSHGILYWLVSLPMTENLALLLFSACLFLIFQKEFTKKKLFFLLLFSTLLIITRIALFPTAFCLSISGLILYNKNQINTQKKLIAVIVFLIVLIIINYIFSRLIGNSLLNYAIFFLKNIFISNNTSFYSFRYIPHNFIQYLKIIFGQKNNFLWNNQSLSSLALLVIVAASFLHNRKALHDNRVTITFSIFASLFLLLLPFYIVDARYVVYLIPVLVSLFVASTNKKITGGFLFIVLFLTILHIYTQLPIFKQVVSENILHRSVAWQYEAIKEIENFIEQDKNNNKITLISALPPHLISAYSSSPIQVMPLSVHQEFLQKKQYVWGNINYDNLFEEYKMMILAGQEVYISNSYITHQKVVTDDFESYKNFFELVQVKAACYNACNIYQLQLK